MKTGAALEYCLNQTVGYVKVCPGFIKKVRCHIARSEKVVVEVAWVLIVTSGLCSVQVIIDLGYV